MSHHHRRAAAVSAPDPYFQDTVLLLTGNGTNGGQNNTFLDSSSNNFTITRNGNTTQGSFSPVGWQWSNYFDGTGDYLTIFDNAALELGAGDFTIEGWMSFSALPTSSNGMALISKWASGQKSWLAAIYNFAGTYQMLFGYSTDGSGQTTITANLASLTVGKWNHFAYCRSGSSFRMFFNGILATSSTIPFALFDGTSTVDIGRTADNYNYINGYISNCRVVKSALYTANFPPFLAPLTAVPNTQLLTCQSNRFIDNSTNNLTIIRTGDVRVSNFAPFPAGEYATSVEGGSGYFDGNGDNLTAADNAAFEFGSGSFSIDCWVYISSLKGYQSFVSKPGATDGNGWNLYLESNNTFRFIAGTGGSWTINIGPTVAVAGQWYHVCITRDTSNQWRLFLNGKLDATTNNSFSQPDLAYPLYVGKYPNFPSYSSAKDFGGYMSSLRIVKGGMPSLFDTSTTTVGTQVFTPPTGPYTGSESLTAGSVSLLMNFTNGSIVDATGKNDLETVGNAQISTSVKKFGTGSMKFDGTGDYLVCNGSTTNLFAFGSGDFTIEFWLYLSSTSGPQIAYDGRPLSTQTTQPTIYIANGGSIRYYTGSADRITGSTLNASQWYHIALSRSGTSTKLFVDGTQSGSTYSDSTNYTNTAGRPVIGIDGFNMNANYLNGYIDDIRITKGVARYTATFTPPYRQLPTR